MPRIPDPATSRTRQALSANSDLTRRHIRAIFRRAGENSIMHVSFVHSASAAVIGVVLALTATPASAQCDPWVCTNPYGPWPVRLPAQARAEPLCLFEPVVWVNATSHVYHVAGTRRYGHSRHGSYMCEAAAKAAGNRAAPR
jgi:hypothetical protein